MRLKIFILFFLFGALLLGKREDIDIDAEKEYSGALELFLDVRTNVNMAVKARNEKKWSRVISTTKKAEKEIDQLIKKIEADTKVKNTSVIDIQIVNEISASEINTEIKAILKKAMNLYIVGLYSECYAQLELIKILMEKIRTWSENALKMQQLGTLEAKKQKDYGLSRADLLFEQAMTNYAARNNARAEQFLWKTFDEASWHKLAKIYSHKVTERNKLINDALESGLQYIKKNQKIEAVSKMAKALAFDPQNKKAVNYTKQYLQKLKQEERNRLFAKMVNAASRRINATDHVNVYHGEGLFRIVSNVQPHNDSVTSQTETISRGVSNKTRDRFFINYSFAGNHYFKRKEFKKAKYFYEKALLYGDSDQIREKLYFAENPDEYDKYLEKQEHRKKKAEEKRLHRLRRQRKLAALKAKIKNLLEQARRLGKSDRVQDLEKALYNLDEVLKLDPDNETAEKMYTSISVKKARLENEKKFRQEIEKYLQKAYNLYKREKYEDSLSQYEIVLELDPGNRTAEEMAAKIREILSKQEKKEKRKDIEKYYRFFEKGLIYYHSDRFKHAASLFQKFLKFVPDDPQAKKYLTLSQKGLRRQMEEKVDINSPFYYIIKNLIKEGKELLKEKKYAASKKRWEQILKIFPRNKIAKQHYLICFKNMDPKLFKEFLQKHYAVGKTLLKRGMKNQAAAEFELINFIAPDYRDTEELMYKAQGTTKKQEKRKKTVKKRKKERQKSIDHQAVERIYQTGMTYYSEKKYDKAKQAWQKVLQLNPDHIKAKVGLKKLNFVAEFNRTGGRNVKSHRSSAGSSKRIKALYAKGMMFYNLKQYQAAIRKWQEVLKLDPSHNMARKNILRCKKILQYN